MKRIYTGLLLLALLVLFSLFSSRCVDRFSDAMEQRTAAVRAALSSPFPESKSEEIVAQLRLCTEQIRTQEHLLAVFVRREALASLDCTLNAAMAYAENAVWEEANAELTRAERQLYALKHQFFRIL